MKSYNETSHKATWRFPTFHVSCVKKTPAAEVHILFGVGMGQAFNKNPSYLETPTENWKCSSHGKKYICKHITTPKINGSPRLLERTWCLSSLKNQEFHQEPQRSCGGNWVNIATKGRMEKVQCECKATTYSASPRQDLSHNPINMMGDWENTRSVPINTIWYYGIGKRTW